MIVKVPENYHNLYNMDASSTQYQLQVKENNDFILDFFRGLFCYSVYIIIENVTLLLNNLKYEIYYWICN